MDIIIDIYIAVFSRTKQILQNFWDISIYKAKRLPTYTLSFLHSFFRTKWSLVTAVAIQKQYKVAMLREAAKKIFL